MPAAVPRSAFKEAAIIIAVTIAAWLVHFTAPADQLDDDQLKPWGYVADIVLHGKWLVQTDYEGAFMSKPPLYPWLCALLAKAGLGVSPLAMYLPTGAAMLGSALIAWHLSRRWFGSGLHAGLAVVLSTLVIKHLCLARTDALFTFTIALTAAAAWRIWNRPGAVSWLMFWGAATLATMTKGPLGVVLGAGGLFAVLWERASRPAEERPALSWRWGWCLLGALGFLVLVGGWFLLAVLDGGRGVIDRMIGRELVGHALRHDRTGEGVFSGWYKPPLYFLSRYVPWGIPSVVAMVRVVREPSPDPLARRAERFLFCWVAAGMLIFCIAPHQRPDLLLPLVPAAAILAAREVDHWLSFAAKSPRRGWQRVATGFWSFAVVFMLFVGYMWHHVGRANKGEINETDAAFAVHDLLRGVPPERIHFASDGWDTQFLWNVKRRAMTPAQAHTAFRGEEPVYVITAGDKQCLSAAELSGARVLFRVPKGNGTEDEFLVLTNAGQ